MKIVLIEDEQYITEALEFLFMQQGWSVVCHNDGATAAALIKAEAPAIVVLDIMILNKNGLDVLRELREDEATAALPVLMLTAKGQATDRAAAELADLGGRGAEQRLRAVRRAEVELARHGEQDEVGGRAAPLQAPPVKQRDGAGVALRLALVLVYGVESTRQQR